MSGSEWAFFNWLSWTKAPSLRLKSWKTWKKLEVSQALSTAFHPQMDNKTERVNQEIEQFLRVFCNYQADNWADLLPFVEFAHNIRAYSATSLSFFQVWYGFQLEFLPPLTLTSRIPSVEDRMKTLDQLQTEVTAALKIASEVIKWKGPDSPSHIFVENQMIWLEGTNVKITHPKAKLAPKWHGPFKIIKTTPTNSLLLLPLSWHIHPMFHNSLLTPYKETSEHGPSFSRPSPDIVKALWHHVIVRTNHVTYHVTQSFSDRSHDERLDPPEQLYKLDLPRS